MRKLPISLSLAAAATLAGCGGHEVRPAPTVALEAPAPAPAADVLRPGYGRVTDVTAVVYPNSTSRGMFRLTLRMDDGTVQVVDTRGPAIPLDERVEITADRNIRYPLASR
jgi:uncharacterized lipoprotein YmbA